jgi:branched-chain amino acid aminotransferase
MTEYKIEINLSSSRKQKPSFDSLEFGKNFTDHMFIVDYTRGIGWHDPRIVPYQPLHWTLPVWYFITDRPFLRVSRLT